MIHRYLIAILGLVCFFNIGYAQNNYHDSVQLYHPEKEFWFPNSMPYILYNRAVSDQSHIIWSTAYHTASPVPIGCVGPATYTHQLKGIIQNTDIGKVMKAAINDGINVILVIGDGMGSVHMTLPIYMNQSNKNSTETMFQKIMKEGECGYVLTNTVNGLVTCSAAAGTAIASGSKTKINMLGVDSIGRPLTNALEVAIQKGMKTALISDANITDATPAAFYGHVVNRDEEAKLAYQLTYNKNIDVILGGGAGLFIPQSKRMKDFQQFDKFPGDYNQFSQRNDTLNLISAFEKKGYTFVCTLSQMVQATDKNKLLGLFAPGGLPASIDRDSLTQNIPSVSQMAAKALNMISSYKNGYFTMIECARIDWEAHANDAGAVYAAVIEMNKILQVAYQFYQKNPSKTLLIFTADHETGGLGIAYTKMEKNETETYHCIDGVTTENNTNPLYFDQFKKLAIQNQSLGRILGNCKSGEEILNSIAKHTGYQITLYQAEEIYKSIMDTKANLKIK